MTERLIGEGGSVAAFPEGTRSEDGRIRPMKKGIFVAAIDSGAPLVPIAIEGTRKVMPKNTFRFRPHPIRVSFGEPIATEGLTYDDRETLIDRVRKRIIELNLSIGGLGGIESAGGLPSDVSMRQSFFSVH